MRGLSTAAPLFILGCRRPSFTLGSASVQAPSNLAAGPDFTATLLRRLAARQATIGVVGLGYVGLPLAVGFADAGHTVVGFDVDASKAALLSAGQSHIPDVPAEEVARLVAAGRFSATTDDATRCSSGHDARRCSASSSGSASATSAA